MLHLSNFSCDNFESIAQALCDEATLLGSTDNITVQVINLKYACFCSYVKSLPNYPFIRRMPNTRIYSQDVGDGDCVSVGRSENIVSVSISSS